MDGFVRVPVREQDAKERATNFKEVCLGYNKEEAEKEEEKLEVILEDRKEKSKVVQSGPLFQEENFYRRVFRLCFLYQTSYI